MQSPQNQSVERTPSLVYLDFPFLVFWSKGEPICKKKQAQPMEMQWKALSFVSAHSRTQLYRGTIGLMLLEGDSVTGQILGSGFRQGQSG